jgi:hypothetical protein
LYFNDTEPGDGRLTADGAGDNRTGMQ